MALGCDGRHGQHERRLCGDVIDDDELRPRRQRPDDRFHHVAGIPYRIRHMNRSEGRATAVTDRTGRERDRAVRQIGDHHLVARTERHRSEHRADACRDIRDKDEILRTRAKELCHLIAGFAQARHGAPRHRLIPVQFAQHESRRLALHFVADRLLFLQDAPRAGAHGAVIEVGEFRIEQPVVQHGAAEGGHPGILPGGPSPGPGPFPNRSAGPVLSERTIRRVEGPVKTR